MRLTTDGLRLITFAVISTVFALFAFMKPMVSNQPLRNASTACGLTPMTFSRTKNTWVMNSSTNGVVEVSTRHSFASSSA